MIKYNCHTHSTFCDGSDSIEDMIIAAINCGMEAIGISSHGPIVFDTDWTMKKERLFEYLEKVDELKIKYKNDIDVLLGLEMDYLPRQGFDYVDSWLLEKLDYYIGSVHYLGELKDGYKWCVDETVEVIRQGVKDNFEGSIEKAIKKYYISIADFAVRYKPPVIGHFDLIKSSNKNNVFFNENDSWYKEIVEDTLNIISKTQCIIEINTGGKARGYTNEYYPSNWILERIRDKNISITINSDAHSINHINYEFDEAYKTIKKLGFKKHVYLTSDGWKKKEVV